MYLPNGDCGQNVQKTIQDLLSGSGDADTEALPDAIGAISI